MDPRRRYHPIDSGDAQWARLLAFALEHADSVEWTIPYRYVVYDMARAPLWPAGLQSLRRDLIDRHASVIRHERLVEQAVQYIRFHLTPPVARFAGSVRHLEDWAWRRGLPEDPSFYMGDQLVLGTESIHGRVTVFADAAEVASLDSAGVRLIEPLGVRAEPWPTP